MEPRKTEILNRLAVNIEIDLFRLKTLVKQGLSEDVGTGDLTVDALLEDKITAKARIIAKAPGIIAGVGLAVLTFTELDPNIKISKIIEDGEQIKKGDEILVLTGDAGSLLSAERTALNFLGHLSGIATQAHRFASAVKDLPVKLYDTRKTTPGLRLLEKYAVHIGGMNNHRFGLYHQVLIKENHLRATQLTLFQAVQKAVEEYKGDIVIGAEAENLDELEQAMQAGAHYVLLDEFSIQQLERAVQMRDEYTKTNDRKVELEASGGVNLENVRKIASTGVDRISIGAVTHSAKNLDLTCLFDFKT